jgi:pentatricopeptide repeat protein
VASALALRASALLQLNRSAAAIDALERAVHIAVEPRAAIGVHLALADAYYQAGRVEDARRVLNEAVQLGAAGPQVDRLETELGSR